MDRIIDSLFFSTWWVIAIFVFSFFLFERGLKSVNQDLEILDKQVEELNAQISLEEAKRFHAHERLSSFEDPAWIELLLIKNLGLIPDGYHKYILIDRES